MEQGFNIFCGWGSFTHYRLTLEPPLLMWCMVQLPWNRALIYFSRFFAARLSSGILFVDSKLNLILTKPFLFVIMLSEFFQPSFLSSFLVILGVFVVQWLSSLEMDTATRVQILDETVGVSHCANTLRKGMNSIILPPAMCKWQGRLDSLTSVWQPV